MMIKHYKLELGHDKGPYMAIKLLLLHLLQEHNHLQNALSSG